MFFYVIIPMATIIILGNLIGFYCLIRKKYNSRFMNFILDKDDININTMSHKNIKKINFLLGIQTIIYIFLALIFSYATYIKNLDFRYLTLILMYILPHITKKVLSKYIYKFH